MNVTLEAFLILLQTIWTLEVLRNRRKISHRNRF